MTRATRLALVAVAVLYASAANAAFRPLEGQRYRYDIVEIRTADTVARRFHTGRSVVFRRTGAGYDAVVTLEAFDQQAGGDVGKMYEAATGSLLHRPLIYHLDPTGKVLRIEDADAVIDIIASAIERLSADRSRLPYAKALASPLRTLPPERKQAMLVSILAGIIDREANDRPPGTRAITLPSRPPLAPGTALAGTETVSRDAAGTITIDTQASGGMDAPAPSGAPTAPVMGARAMIHAIRNVDPTTGLVRDSRDVIETTMVAGTETHLSRTETTVTLDLVLKS